MADLEKKYELSEKVIELKSNYSTLGIGCKIEATSDDNELKWLAEYIINELFKEINKENPYRPESRKTKLTAEALTSAGDKHWIPGSSNKPFDYSNREKAYQQMQKFLIDRFKEERKQLKEEVIKEYQRRQVEEQNKRKNQSAQTKTPNKKNEPEILSLADSLSSTPENEKNKNKAADSLKKESNKLNTLINAEKEIEKSGHKSEAVNMTKKELNDAIKKQKNKVRDEQAKLQNVTKKDKEEKLQRAAKIISEKKKKVVTSEDLGVRKLKKIEMSADIEIEFEVKKESFISDDIQYQIDTLSRALKETDTKERRDLIASALQLNMEQYIIVNDKTKQVSYAPKFAIQRLCNGRRKTFKSCKTKNGDALYLSESEYKKIMKAKEKPFDTYYINRYIGKNSTEVTGLHAKLNKSEELFRKIEDLDIGLDDSEDVTFDLKRICEEIENAERKISKDEYTKLKKYVLEYRAKLLRIIQNNYRSKLRPISFNGDVKTNVHINMEKLINKSLSEVTRLLLDANKNIKGDVATIGWEQSVSEKEIFSKKYNIEESFDLNGDGLTQHFNKQDLMMRGVNYQEARLYDEKFNYMDKDANSVNTNTDNPLRKNKAWVKTKIQVPITLYPQITDVTTYEIKAVMKPAIVKNKKATTKLNGEKLEVDYGCLFAATYFYTLVSNTPIDEEYDKINDPYDSYNTGEKNNIWHRAAEIALKKRLTHKFNDEFKTIAEIKAEIEERTSKKPARTVYRSRTHKPDNSSVRADWIMRFRGVTFKAFDSDQTSNKKRVKAQYTFTSDHFMNPVTNMDHMNLQRSDIYNEKGMIKNSIFKPYIWNLAQEIAIVVNQYGNIDSDTIAPVVENINPRWIMLEYGLYTSEGNGPYKGKGKYGLPHGLTHSGFSFQAPRGFKRIVDAQYNAILAHSVTYQQKKNGVDIGLASSYTRANRSLRWNFDITQADQLDMLLEELSKYDSTLKIENIHNIDSSIVWEVKKI